LFKFKKDKAISNEVIALSIPVILSNISRVLMGIIDMGMVGRLGANAIAAVGMGSMIVWVLMSLGISLRTATQTLSARRLGQKK
jgi:multidrug resistance protein, MATE family